MFVLAPAQREVSTVIHGDDITSLGSAENLDWFEREISNQFEIKLQGRLGQGLATTVWCGIRTRSATR